MKLKNISFDKIKLTDGFWAEKQALIRNAAMMTVYNRFDDTGRIGAFACDWEEGKPCKPHFFWDSDVAKWIESVAYVTRLEPSPELEALADGIIDNLEKNQFDDGYFNIYYTVVNPGQRFTNRNNHELYCAGHLLEAAIAYKEATGKDKLYNCMLKYVDLIERVFMIEDSAEFVTPGHEELELALVKLYDHSQNERYLKLARFFVDKRGANTKDNENSTKCNVPYSADYFQNQCPIREQTTAEGHAVRLCYLYVAVADLAYRTGDEGLKNAAYAVFENIIDKRMYITGGVGSTPNGEKFETDYMLDNLVSYNETCATLSLALFAHRMQELFDDSRYADIAERAIYNGFISGMSLDGNSYFYQNPMKIDLDARTRTMGGRFKIDPPITRRVSVFNCSCCPPNITRFIPSIANFLYTLDDTTLRVNQFMASEGEFEGIKIAQKTNYPFDGKVEISYSGDAKILALRFPSWCDEFKLSVNGAPVSYELKNGYVRFAVKDGDSIVYEMEIKPTFNYSNPKIAANASRTAVSMGPLVYCVEAVDNKGFSSAEMGLDSLYIDTDEQPEVGFDEELKLPTIYAKATYREPITELYTKERPKMSETTVKFIPYHAFANRGESDMQVWMICK